MKISIVSEGKEGRKVARQERRSCSIGEQSVKLWKFREVEIASFAIETIQTIVSAVFRAGKRFRVRRIRFVDLWT